MKLKKINGKINPKKLLSDSRGYCDRVHYELESKGVKFFTPDETLHLDKDYLILPKNITDASTKELGEYLNAFTQQKAYMRTLVGYAELFCEEARRDYLLASEQGYRELLSTKLSETAKEREVNSNPDVKPYYEKYIESKDNLKILNLNIASIEDIIFMISREVSRRTGDFKDDNREYNVSRR